MARVMAIFIQSAYETRCDRPEVVRQIYDTVVFRTYSRSVAIPLLCQFISDNDEVDRKRDLERGYPILLEMLKEPAESMDFDGWLCL